MTENLEAEFQYILTRHVAVWECWNTLQHLLYDEVGADFIGFLS
jgi:hypothetical protein